MSELQWVTRPKQQPRSVAGLLGSFDPPHLGHVWIVHRLLERFDLVALLVPAFHFEKSVRFPDNARLSQRLAMLRVVRKAAPQRIALGVAHQVLYLQVAANLRDSFPHATVGFGMGNESYQKLLDSPQYCRRIGLPWTDDDRQAIEILCRNVVVFARTAQARDALAMPECVRHLSSTSVRARVHQWADSPAVSIYEERLQDMVLPGVAALIGHHELYRGQLAPQSGRLGFPKCQERGTGSR
jgi:cytidyltransferase-like protein